MASGRLELSCPRAISKDAAYPVTTVVPDVAYVDDVPGCSDKVLATNTLFGVNSDLTVRLLDENMAPVVPTKAWIDSRPTVAARNKDAADARGGTSAMAPDDICRHVNR